MADWFESTGDGTVGVNLASHVSGDPFEAALKGQVTVGHTWVILVVALGLLWLAGAGIFRGIRM